MSKQVKEATIPSPFIGFWSSNNMRFEFRADGHYYIYSKALSYELTDNGTRLIYHHKIPYVRTSGDPTQLYGTWLMDDGSQEEWYLREDNSYVIHIPEDSIDYIGGFSFDETTITIHELRAFISSIDANTIRFSNIFADTYDITYTLTEPELTLHFPQEDVVYTRESEL